MKNNYLYSFILIALLTCSVMEKCYTQKRSETLIEIFKDKGDFENANNKNIPKSLSSFLTKFKFCNQDNLIHKLKVKSVSDSIIVGYGYSDNSSPLYFLYKKNSEEIHVLSEYSANDIRSLSFIDIYNLDGFKRYSFLNHVLTYQNYTINSNTLNGSSCISKSISFNIKSVEPKNNEGISYVKIERQLAENSILQYLKLIIDLKNELEKPNIKIKECSTLTQLEIQGK